MKANQASSSFCSKSQSELLKDADPYEMDFKQLREEYEAQTTIKVPFAKSTFVHYSKCPRKMKINDQEYSDLILTMEVVQIPTQATFTNLHESKSRGKTEVDQSAKQPDEGNPFERAEVNNKLISDIAQPGGGDDDADLIEHESIDVTIKEQQEPTDSDEDGMEDSSSEESGSEPESEEEKCYGGDRLYQGNMFKQKPIRLVPKKTKIDGEPNQQLQTTESCNISIWSSSEILLRYRRLKNTIIPVPCISSYRQFRISHDAKRLFYLGIVNDEKKLVVVYIKDLSYMVYDLGENSAEMMTLDQAALFRHYLCYKIEKKETLPTEKGRSFYRIKKEFFVYNLKTKELEWELGDCVSVQFLGSNSDKLASCVFQERKIKFRATSDEDDTDLDEEAGQNGPKLILEEEPENEFVHTNETQGDDGQEHVSKMMYCHKGILVVKTTVETVALTAADAQHQDDEQTEKRRYIRSYYPKWKQKDYDVGRNRLFYETFIVLQDENPNLAKRSKQGAQGEPELLIEHEIKWTTDCDVMVQALIVKGIQGEQHRVYIFNPEHCKEIQMTNRAGDTDLEFNMNAHIRQFTKIFLIQTESSGSVTAKPLDFLPPDVDEDLIDLIPPILFTAPKKGSIKDCWVIEDQDASDHKNTETSDKKNEEGPSKFKKIMTICMSADGDFIAQDCIIPLNNPNLDLGEKFKLERRAQKAEAQEVQLNYPCIVSNIGNNHMLIQSVTQPDQIACLRLNQLSCNQQRPVEFVCFTQYKNLSDIGFVDRHKGRSDVPIEEKGEKVAFITRTKGFCDSKGECKGDLLLNVLQIDAFGSTIRYELYTTTYEACMDGGVSDDYVQKCFTTQLTSERGLDVTFVTQYRDRIIFDCVTSTVQKPIRFPMPKDKAEQEKWAQFDPDWKQKNGQDVQFDQLEIARGGNMVPQKMIQGDHGAIYWMMQEGDTVKVLRADQHQEMGNEAFIQCVFTLRSKKIFFLLKQQGLFYIMDDTKKIRVLKADPQTQMWKQIATKELMPQDAQLITYSEFQEFAVSPQTLMFGDRLVYIFTNSKIKSHNYSSDFYNVKDFTVTYGPYRNLETGMCWNIQSHLQTKNKSFDDEEIQFQESEFRGHLLVLQPLTDSSFVDILPQKDVNNNNFISFLTDDQILVNYSGRFVVLDPRGKLLGQVQFTNTCPGFKQDQIKLAFVSDSHRFFVFEGKRFLSKAEKEAANKAALEKVNAEQKARETANAEALAEMRRKEEEAEKEKADLKQTGGSKAKIYYTFRLEVSQEADQYYYKFVPLKNLLNPEMDQDKKEQTTYRVDHTGKVSQCYTAKGVPDGDNHRVDVVVNNYRCHEEGKLETLQSMAAGAVSKSWFDFGNSSKNDPVSSEEKYSFRFSENSGQEANEVIENMLHDVRQKLMYGVGSKEVEEKLVRRQGQIERAWVFDNYVVAKSGKELLYAQRQRSTHDSVQKEQIKISLSLDYKVWIHDIYPTGVQDLVQFLLIDDQKRHVFLMTWNLQLNREHNLFQTDFDEGMFAENLVLRGLALHKVLDFNYILDKRQICDMQDNLPVQFFDLLDDPNVLPTQVIYNQVEGMKRISSDRSRYLDLIKPGRVHHFCSITDILYLQRYIDQKDKHEISVVGAIQDFSPLVRFYGGSTIFHHFAADIKLLKVVTDTFKSMQSKKQDTLMKSVPLLFMSSNPLLNQPGKKTTPIHIAFDKQSPAAFELMFELLVDQPRHCVTGQLFDVLKYIIESTEPSVIKFFDESFYVTDQFRGLHALRWADDLDEEMIVDIPCAFLSNEFLQSIVSTENTEVVNENEAAQFKQQSQERRKSVIDRFSPGVKNFSVDELPSYSGSVELCSYEHDSSQVKQVEAKILDFSWVFTGQNAAYVIQILSQSANDAIFATAQIRVFIDFMWDSYYHAILTRMFVPFMINFGSFLMYASYFAQLYAKNKTATHNAGEVICVILYLVTLIVVILQELATCKYSKGLAYFKDPWNYLDIASIVLNMIYIFKSLTRKDEDTKINVLGSFCIFIFYLKAFYWMRLFKPFSAFIRMIREILSDVRIFFIVLSISICAYANTIFILNINRTDDYTCITEDGNRCEPIFEGAFGKTMIDSVLHSYLVSLGDFRTDTYVEADNFVTWIFFLLATIVIQLIFMNLLIAIMGESFSRINEIIDQSTLKELCILMNDHVWILDIAKTYQDKRYILWLTPDTTENSGSVVERGVNQIIMQHKTLATQLDQVINNVESSRAELESVKQMVEQSNTNEHHMAEDLEKFKTKILDEIKKLKA